MKLLGKDIDVNEINKVMLRHIYASSPLSDSFNDAQVHPPSMAIHSMLHDFMNLSDDDVSMADLVELGKLVRSKKFRDLLSEAVHQKPQR